MDKVANITIPAGTPIIKGSAASQGGQLVGGRTQYYVPREFGANLKVK